MHILTMRKVTANTDPRASTVRDTTLALIPHSLSEVAEPHAYADFSNQRGIVQRNLLHGLKVDHCQIISLTSQYLFFGTHS
jgi:hypothetical protein